MSIQVGIRCFHGNQVFRQEIAFLLQGLERRSPDYVHIHLGKALGIGFRGLLVAPEDRSDQPLIGSTGSVITLDGRIDTREDLATRLGVAPGSVFSDARLALAAYERWGKDCFEMLQGELAVTIIDAETASLFFYRSLCGTRPLFFIVKADRIVWSSELDDLVVKSGIDPIVNDSYAVGYAYFQPDIDQSPFQNVHTVPPGTFVEITKTKEIRPPISVWHPERIRTLHLRSDGDYEEAWRYHVDNAIAKKLRATGPIFCELSGGLDSTTLVLLADRILQRSGRNPSGLVTTSLFFETSTTCDESRFIHIAEDARGRKGIPVPESVQHPTFGLTDTTFTGAPNAHRFTPGRYLAIAEAMRRAGARVLLTGIGGDHLFWSDQGGSPELADLLAGWRFWPLLSQGKQWGRVSATPLWQVLVSHAIAPLALTTPLVRWLPSDLSMFPWVTAKARRLVTKPGHDQGMQVTELIKMPSRRVRETMIRSFRALVSAGYFDGYQEIYFSHPYSNQQLIDFILAIPMNQLVHPGKDRYLMRRATRGLLPEPIRTRRSKATINEAACRVLEREQHEIGDPGALEVCQRGYAEPRALAEAMRRIAMGRMDHSYAFLRLMNVEQWIRSFDTIKTRRSELKHVEESLSLGSDQLPSSTSVPIRHSITATS